MRARTLWSLLRSAFVASCRYRVPGGPCCFRICQFSIQRNHIHLICEADDNTALSRGMQAFSIRLGKRLNRHWHRTGTVFDGRYHSEILKHPRRVKNALHYVLFNALKHKVPVSATYGGIDPYTSAWYFDGFQTDAWRQGLSPPPTSSTTDKPVADPTTWLLTTGWRRHGLLALPSTS